MILRGASYSQGGDLNSRKPSGPNKRKRGDIWAQLGVSACVLLLPPLGLAAGVMVFGRSIPQDPEYAGAAQQAPASQTTVTKSVALAQRPDHVTDFGLASAEQHPVIAEQPAATAQREASAQPAATKDPTRYYGAIPVTLVRIRKSSEPSAMADIEGPSSTVAAADAAIAVPEQSPAATGIHASRASRRMGRHEPRNVYQARREHAHSLNEPRRMAGVASTTVARVGTRRPARYQNRNVRLQ
jgi:hypothetical protein